MTIGLLGGTFDPIHQGHIDVARAARQALDLDEVWVVPARVPPHRRRPLASAAHRFAMAALVTADEPGLSVSDLEMDRTGPSYTVDTLDAVSSVVPPDSRLFFVIGADAFRDVPSWRAYPDVLDRCHFAVVSRPGLPARALREALPDLAARMQDTPCALPASPSILLVHAATSAVSSTDVRRRLADGRSVDGLVPRPVSAYIARHRLYLRQEPQNA